MTPPYAAVAVVFTAVIGVVSVGPRSRSSSAYVRSHGEGEREPQLLQEATIDHEGHFVRFSYDTRTEDSILTLCNRQYILQDEGSDDCASGEKILSEEDCDHAASFLGKTKRDPFAIDTHYVSPQPYPHGCFLNTSTDLVVYNPTEPNATEYSGQKICLRSKYVNGTANTDPAEGCTGDGSKIETYGACWEAALCVGGGGVCRQLNFTENRSMSSDNLPSGCFMDHEGCWGFNSLQSAPAGDIAGTPVCAYPTIAVEAAAG